MELKGAVAEVITNAALLVLTNAHLAKSNRGSHSIDIRCPPLIPNPLFDVDTHVEMHTSVYLRHYNFFSYPYFSYRMYVVSEGGRGSSIRSRVRC